MELIARVEPLTLTRAVRGPFDYRLGPDQPGIGVGSLVRIPFGRSRTVGVVVELVDRSELPLDRLAEPEEVLPGSVPADLVSMARWMAFWIGRPTLASPPDTGKSLPILMTVEPLGVRVGVGLRPAMGE